MNIVDVDVVGSKPLQAITHSKTHAFERIAHRVDVVILAVSETRVLCCKHDLVAVSSGLHPFSDPFFGLSFVVQVAAHGDQCGCEYQREMDHLPW